MADPRQLERAVDRQTGALRSLTLLLLAALTVLNIALGAGVLLVTLQTARIVELLEADAAGRGARLATAVDAAVDAIGCDSRLLVVQLYRHERRDPPADLLDDCQP